MGAKRRGKTKGSPPGRTNRPKVAATSNPEVLDEKPQFCFQYVDKWAKGAYGYSFGQNDAETVLDFLADRSRETWRTILSHRDSNGQKHHSHHVSDMPNGSRRDYERLDLDKFCGGELFRFRLGSTRRLWGFRADHMFHVVWWDPDHKVYPSEPKNT